MIALYRGKLRKYCKTRTRPGARIYPLRTVRSRMRDLLPYMAIYGQKRVKEDQDRSRDSFRICNGPYSCPWYPPLYHVPAPQCLRMHTRLRLSPPRSQSAHWLIALQDTTAAHALATWARLHVNRMDSIHARADARGRLARRHARTRTCMFVRTHAHSESY